MNKQFTTVIGAVSGLMTLLLVGAAQAQAPDPFNPNNRFLTINPSVGLPIIPVMEGWYPNPDGGYTISFGYHNRNADTEIDIPIGENNFFEPAEFNGMQPTHFLGERDIGVFTVVIPASMKDESIWWNIKTGDNEILKVPGRGGIGAYQLDRMPRPQGSVSPDAWFDDGSRGAGPDGPTNSRVITAKVGEPVALSVHLKDPSVRDPSDPRFEEPLSLHMQWFHHQGPGKVEFTKHESTIDPPPPPERPNAPPGLGRRAPGPSEVTLPIPEGTASVYATFSEPGEYVVRARVDNWNAADSSAGNQCCWTNAYQRVSVSN